MKLPDTEQSLPALQRVTCSPLKSLSFWSATSPVLTQHWRGHRVTHQLHTTSNHLIFRGCSLVLSLSKPKPVTWLWACPCQSHKPHSKPRYQFLWHYAAALNQTRTLKPTPFSANTTTYKGHYGKLQINNSSNLPVNRSPQIIQLSFQQAKHGPASFLSSPSSYSPILLLGRKKPTWSLR